MMASRRRFSSGAGTSRNVMHFRDGCFRQASWNASQTGLGFWMWTMSALLTTMTVSCSKPSAPQRARSALRWCKDESISVPNERWNVRVCSAVHGASRISIILAARLVNFAHCLHAGIHLPDNVASSRISPKPRCKCCRLSPAHSRTRSNARKSSSVLYKYNHSGA